MGQFTQPDPIGLAGGLNLYGYADGDPINKSDPFGLRACNPPGTCVSRGAAVGATMGAALGVTAAASCAGVTAGVCALGAPAIIGGSISLFISAGIAAGAIEENADAIVSEMSRLGNRIRSILTGILIGKGGGLSEEQEVIRQGGARPPVEQAEEERRKRAEEKKRGEGSPPDDPPEAA